MLPKKGKKIKRCKCVFKTNYLIGHILKETEKKKENNCVGNFLEIVSLLYQLNIFVQPFLEVRHRKENKTQKKKQVEFSFIEPFSVFCSPFEKFLEGILSKTETHLQKFKSNYFISRPIFWKRRIFMYFYSLEF
jgi:hypothetical protein